MGVNGVRRLPPTSLPALLISYVYLAPFEKTRHNYAYRSWVLDSGAFSAFSSGKVIDLQAYIDTCKRLIETDPTLTEVYALDVIGDWRAGLKNTEEMWRQGVKAIPAYHIGEPWDLLRCLARDYPKIALGGVAKRPEATKTDWAEQCFARVWPKKIHGFGMSGRKLVLRLPFHSVDSTTWELAACGFGNWRSYGKLSWRGSKQNLRVEVEYYLRLEREMQRKWRKEMEQLNREGADAESPTIKLGLSPGYNKCEKCERYGVALSNEGREK